MCQKFLASAVGMVDHRRPRRFEVEAQSTAESAGKIFLRVSPISCCAPQVRGHNWDTLKLGVPTKLRGHSGKH